MKQRELKQAPATTTQRKAYRKPELKEFGTISELTHGGQILPGIEDDIYSSQPL